MTARHLPRQGIWHSGSVFALAAGLLLLATLPLAFSRLNELRLLGIGTGVVLVAPALPLCTLLQWLLEQPGLEWTRDLASVLGVLGSYFAVGALYAWLRPLPAMGWRRLLRATVLRFGATLLLLGSAIGLVCLSLRVVI